MGPAWSASETGPVLSCEMFVSDLRRFLDMPDDAPGPARKMADQLGNIVRAATAADTGSSWVSALPCRRRPGHRPCPGHIAVFRADLPAPIQWACSSCDDEGVISGWQDSPFDLRRFQISPGPQTQSDGSFPLRGGRRPGRPEAVGPILRAPGVQRPILN